MNWCCLFWFFAGKFRLNLNSISWLFESFKIWWIFHWNGCLCILESSYSTHASGLEMKISCTKAKASSMLWKKFQLARHIKFRGVLALLYRGSLCACVHVCAFYECVGVQVCVCACVRVDVCVCACECGGGVGGGCVCKLASACLDLWMYENRWQRKWLDSVEAWSVLKNVTSPLSEALMSKSWHSPVWWTRTSFPSQQKLFCRAGIRTSNKLHEPT